KKFIIHNGINCSEFISKSSACLAGEPALITVGNLTDRKGQENVIKALPEIATLFPKAVYHLIGKPTNKHKFEATAKALQVDKKLQFYGAVTRDDLLDKLQGATIKLMLSNHTKEGDFEGFGIAVLEANAFGIPAIGSRNSGIADAIEHNKTGVLVNQLDKQEVANAIDTIMNNYSFFSNNARNWAIQHDWKNIVKEYVAAIKE
ncbi:MAG TPA: glycosyltransferase family 4 protein, partial [Segetibacter sp.]